MATGASEILPVLQDVLNRLSKFPYPCVPTPEGCKKRASVAVIVRIRPAFTPVSAANGSVVSLEQPELPTTSLDEFFSQPWVQQGDPEVLFIKRAGRAGDRWSGHIALPGGKRDREDDSDISAAIRETREEVGLDLSSADCIRAGNLPERIVSTTFGKEALMVLCPYLFVLTSKTTPRLQPQPSEVAALHWIPLRALLSPSLRRKEYVDTASRMAKQGGPVLQKILRLLVGRMMFSAISLVPSESIYASSIAGFIPTPSESLFSGLAEGAFGVPSSTQGLAHQQPLLLWGLTLGVLADFLDMLPPYNAVKLWTYPTFTPPDLRVFVYLFTRSVRMNNADDLSAGTWPKQTAVDSMTQAVTVTEAEPVTHTKHNEVGIGGLGVGSVPGYAVGKLLTGYYERMNYAIVAFLMYRATFSTGFIYLVLKYWKKRQLSRL